MKIVMLMENTSCREDIAHAHGLSMYVETPGHKILFDMGPDGAFADNADKLGVDLAAVDIAVLSHGHYDHGGGLRTFLRRNSRAKVYVHRAAFGAYYALEADQGPRYIGLDPTLIELEDRLVFTDGVMHIDEELTLFSDVPENFSLQAASAKLQTREGESYRPDDFCHEQSLLIEAEGRTVLLAGCAHRGIVNICNRAEALAAQRPDVALAGFHLFELPPNDPGSDALIAALGEALRAGRTRYYTGHCTGEYAYGRLAAILGDRLRPMTGGSAIQL